MTHSALGLAAEAAGCGDFCDGNASAEHRKQGFLK